MSNIKEELAQLRAKIESARSELYLVRMTHAENRPKTFSSDKKKFLVTIREAKIKINELIKGVRQWKLLKELLLS